MVKVADHGPGVRKEIEELLFKRPIDHQGKKKGLGLLLVKLVSQAYGGDAWLDMNNPGEGAIFAFSMPVIPSSA